MNSDFSPEKSLEKVIYLEKCLKLRSYDYRIERVFQEVTELFSSQELQQRLQQKRMGVRK
jgi:hypothetical protein